MLHCFNQFRIDSFLQSWLCIEGTAHTLTYCPINIKSNKTLTWISRYLLEQLRASKFLSLPKALFNQIAFCHIILKAWNIRIPKQFEQIRIRCCHIRIVVKLLSHFHKSFFSLLCFSNLLGIQKSFQENLIILFSDIRVNYEYVCACQQSRFCTILPVLFLLFFDWQVLVNEAATASSNDEAAGAEVVIINCMFC